MLHENERTLKKERERLRKMRCREQGEHGCENTSILSISPRVKGQKRESMTAKSGKAGDGKNKE